MKPSIIDLDGNAIALIVSAFINAIAVAVAIAAVREAQKLRKAQTSPEIAVYLDLSPNAVDMIDLVVRNVGAGSAYDVRVELSDPAFGGRALEVWDDEILKSLRYIPPGHTYRFFITAAAALIPMEKPIRAVVKYNSSAGDNFDASFWLDDRPLRGLVTGGRPLHSIAESLQQITNALTQTGIGMRGARDPSPRLRVEIIQPRSSKKGTWKQFTDGVSRLLTKWAKKRLV